MKVGLGEVIGVKERNKWGCRMSECSDGGRGRRDEKEKMKVRRESDEGEGGRVDGRRESNETMVG